jgi:molybdopterin-guanine dinucleotide biosynthesis protein A
MNAGFIEPLVGSYNANCALVIRRMLSEGELRPHKLIGKVKNLVIPEAEMLKIDPSKMTYFNVNTPLDLLEAETRLKSGHNQ